MSTGVIELHRRWEREAEGPALALELSGQLPVELEELTVRHLVDFNDTRIMESKALGAILQGSGLQSLKLYLSRLSQPSAYCRLRSRDTEGCSTAELMCQEYARIAGLFSHFDSITSFRSGVKPYSDGPSHPPPMDMVNRALCGFVMMGIG